MKAKFTKQVSCGSWNHTERESFCCNIFNTRWRERDSRIALLVTNRSSLWVTPFRHDALNPITCTHSKDYLPPDMSVWALVLFTGIPKQDIVTLLDPHTTLEILPCSQRQCVYVTEHKQNPLWLVWVFTQECRNKYQTTDQCPLHTHLTAQHCPSGWGLVPHGFLEATQTFLNPSVFKLFTDNFWDKEVHPMTLPSWSSSQFLVWNSINTFNGEFAAIKIVDIYFQHKNLYTHQLWQD